MSSHPSPSPSPGGPAPWSRAELEETWRVLVAAIRHPGPSLYAWSLAFRVEDRGPLDFELFPFQRELYEAFGDRELPTVDVMKSAQCGVSAAGVSLALYAADVWGANVLYVLPTEEMAHAFSDTRVRPVIGASPYLSALVTDTDNKGLKRLGEANVYFAGSGSERRALSIPADLLILDEYDRLDRRQISRFQRRLAAPTSLRLERAFSNPRFPEDGIHARYLASDQRTWLVRCPACRHEAPLTYAAADGSHFVREADPARVCGLCHLPLGPAAIAAGRWVAAHPGAGGRGYHISRLIVPGEDAAEIVAKHRLTAEEEVQTHYNFDLGLPYAPRGGSLARDQVLACRRDYTPPPAYAGSQWVTAGVDVGGVLHVRISRWLESGQAAALYIGAVGGFEDLGQLWRAFNVNFGLVDERPEERAARAFMEAFRGRCMLVRWAGDEQRDPIVVDDDRGLVVARRTGACDRLVAAVQGQQRLLPRTLPKDYLSHLTAPHRVTETTSRGQKVARYVSEREDHFFFAELHDVLAKEARGGEAAGGYSDPPPTMREELWRRRGSIFQRSRGF